MPSPFDTILTGLAEGSVVPFLGPDTLRGVIDTASGKPMPADSNSLILAMNNGAPMAPKLMFEFPRAAMHVELKRGRSAVQKFLDATYRDTAWSPSPLHQWLAGHAPAYTVDCNRDLCLQNAWATRPHTLIVGVARIAGNEYRFKIYRHDGAGYHAIDQDDVDVTLPILFKPVGTPLPESNYIASDADYVDYLTELMGGFAIPGFIKRMRQGRRYLVMGMRFTRDTERMLLSEIAFGADNPAGWVLIDKPSDKERRFLERLKFTVVEADVADFLAAAGVPAAEAA
jgi:hypothetical protein